MSEAGRRCPARARLEFDHIEPVALGGQASVAGIRLRCRPHNQYEAERTFGTEFMRHQRLVAAEARATAKVRAAAKAREAVRAPARTQAVRSQAAATAHTQAVTAEQITAAEQARERDVVPWLRQLGFRADEVRRGVELCAALPDASLEERVHLAVSSLARGGLRRAMPGVPSSG